MVGCMRQAEQIRQHPAAHKIVCNGARVIRKTAAVCKPATPKSAELRADWAYY